MKIDAELIKRLRAEKQWSQEQLGEMCGLNLRTIQRLEKSGNASLESVRALASVFGIDAKQFLCEETLRKLNPIDSIKSSLMQFDDFSGKAGRYEYWWFLLFMLLVQAIAQVVHDKAYIVTTLIFLVPFLAVGSRRLRDTGQSPWWQLMFLAPFGFVVPLILMAYESKGEQTAEVESAMNL